MNGVLPAALAETVLVTYRDVKSGGTADNPVAHLPMPSQYSAIVLVYGTLSLFSGDASKFAALAGWGFVVATFLNLWTPNKSGSGVSVTKQATTKASTTTSGA